MSKELTKARSQITKVRTFLKQEKYIPAVQSLYDALLAILRSPLMKQEREEFVQMLSDAVYQLDSHRGFRAIIPLKLTYAPGKEKELLFILRDCLEELQNSALGDAKKQLEELERRRAAELARGQGLVDEKRFGEARDLFSALVKEFPDDSELKGEIGDIFLKAQQYEDAYTYLSQALEDSPGSLHLYNRIGIALRKMGLFETAEKYYFKALDIIHDDANLYFNIGRLYVDWQRWDKVAEMAARALQLDPGFKEAQKMLNFAQKRL